MASLEDFSDGKPLTSDPLQAIVDYVDNLSDEQARVVWHRRVQDQVITRDTGDGDDIIVLAHYGTVDNVSVASNQTDVNVNITFPRKFSRPPVVIPIPHAVKPLMCSINSVTNDGAVVSLRSFVTGDQAINVIAVSYIAIGPKATT